MSLIDLPALKRFVHRKPVILAHNVTIAGTNRAPFSARYPSPPKGFWTARVAGFEAVKLEPSILDQRLDCAIEMATTADTFPNRS